MSLQLSPREAGGGRVLRLSDSAWRLEIPAGTASSYRLAQLDDTGGLARGRFAHHGSFALEVMLRASANDLTGTWGVGFWNEPFGLGLMPGGGLRLPALPNAAWFFHASPANHLSLRDDLPASGFLTQVFRSPLTWPFLPFAVGLPLLAWPAAARLLRRLVRGFVREDGVKLSVDAREWRRCRIDCAGGGVRFGVDGVSALETPLAPRGRLGMALWIDNQYASFGPDGKIRAGLQDTPQPAWIEVEIAAG